MNTAKEAGQTLRELASQQGLALVMVSLVVGVYLFESYHDKKAMRGTLQNLGKEQIALFKTLAETLQSTHELERERALLTKEFTAQVGKQTRLLDQISVTLAKDCP